MNYEVYMSQNFTMRFEHFLVRESTVLIAQLSIDSH